jgi:N-acetylmuramic acid 6-phosphate (MurNAc-6-P) etherase
VMVLAGIDATDARRRLEAAGGFVRTAVQAP